MERNLRLVFVNSLTSLRVIFAFVVVYLAYEDLWHIIFILTPLVLATDWADGELARRWNVISDFGKNLDPIADKMITAAFLWVIMVYYDFYVSYVVLSGIVLLYGFAIASLFTLNKKLTGRFMRVNRIGKYNSAILMIALGLIVFGILLDNEGGISEFFQILGLIVFGIAAAMSFVTFIKYLSVFRINMKAKHEAH